MVTGSKDIVRTEAVGSAPAEVPNAAPSRSEPPVHDSTVPHQAPMLDLFRAAFQDPTKGYKNGTIEQKSLSQMKSGVFKFVHEHVKNMSQLTDLTAIEQHAQALHDAQSHEKVKPGIWGWLQNAFNIFGYRDRQVAATKDLEAIKDATQRRRQQLVYGENFNKALEPAQEFLNEFQNRKRGHMTREQRDDFRAKQKNALSALDQLKAQSKDKDDLSKLETLRSRVESAIIPKSEGESIRYAQARYKVRTLIDLGTTIKDAQAHFDSQRSQYKSLYQDGAASQPTMLQYGDAMANKAADEIGLRPVARTALAAEKVSGARSAFLNAASKKDVFQISTPTHAMLAITDPASSTYRFFDPNIGMLKFNDSETFAKIAAEVTGSYQRGASEETTDLRPFIEAPISQGGVDPNFALSSGVCLAMSHTVAKYFLEHPDFSGTITSKILGLPEFDVATTHLVSGNNLLAQGRLKEASSAFYEVISAYPKEYLQAIKQPIFKAISSGDLQKAAQLVDAALEERPEDPVLLALEGRIKALAQAPTPASQAPSRIQPENISAQLVGESEAAAEEEAPTIKNTEGHTITLTSLALKAGA